jgi:uncharacterized integral membrane protein (TIGR00697 family)
VAQSGPMRLDARQTLFLYLVGVFVTTLLVGNLIGGKLVQPDIGGMTDWAVISVGMIPFPLTFLLTDIVNEFYGKQVARKLTMLGFFMTALAFGIVYIADAIPWAPFTQEDGWKGMNEGSFQNVFVSATRIQIASMIAYLVAQYVDIGAFFLIKRATGNRFLWLRATGSTVLSQLVDTVVIQTIAWYGILPASQIVSIAVTSYIVKVTIAIAMTPVLYAGHTVVERKFGIHPIEIEPDSGGGHERDANAAR